MNEQELILLGLLKQSPKHGYEIKKEIKGILSLFAGVEMKSIYYPLTLLEKKGMIKKSTSRSGKRPMRFVYSLTPEGEERLKKVITESLLSFKRPKFSLDLSLYFLNFIKPAIARRRLRARLSILKKLSQDLSQMVSYQKERGARPSLLRILAHNLQMVDAESRFLADLTRSFNP